MVQAAGLGSLFPWGDKMAAKAVTLNSRGTGSSSGKKISAGPANETVTVVNGMRHKRLGGGEIFVSEFGLGTQRWGGADFNSPDEKLCHEMLDLAVLEKGVSLIDTAEQYPIPSDRAHPEGNTEKIIGRWLAKDQSRRDKVVLATKITGGANVTKKNIKKDLEGSLLRFGVDHIDIYNLHWPARYTPQSNWGQSLQYHLDTEQAPYYKNHASFGEIVEAMSELIDQGKLRGWGMCNDNAYGLTASCYAAYAQNGHAPCVMQNDFSLINRRVEENGLSEASSPVNENVGFMAYNVLAGGVLTGKYLDVAAAVDNPNDRELAEKLLSNPRGRMDDYSWGKTLYRYRSGPAGDATRAYAALASDAGMSLTELALKWAASRDAVTTSLIGHTSIDQLQETLQYYDQNETDKSKPLPDDLLWEVDRVHMRNRLPIFSSDRVGADWGGAGEIGERLP